MKPNAEFWTKIDGVVAAHPIVIDRPKGMAHPRCPEMTYPVNYGFLDGTRSMDGGGIDVFVGSTSFAQVDGVICTVDSEKQDIEIKVLYSCTADEMAEINALLNGEGMAGLLFVRE